MNFILSLKQGIKLPGSLRYRLPITYGAIALLVVLVLGLVLRFTLLSYYAARERDYLEENAVPMSEIFATMLTAESSDPELQAQVQLFSFLVRTRVEILDLEGRTLAASVIFEDAQRFTRIAADSAPGVPGGEGNWQAAEGGAVFVSPGLPGSVVLGSGSHETDDPAQGLLEVHPPFPGDEATRVSVIPSFWGYDLSRENPGRGGADRSDQVIETAIRDENAAAIGTLRLSNGPSYGGQIVRGVMGGWLLASVVSVVVAGAVGWLVGRAILTPLQTLTRATVEMANGDLSTRAHVERDDEFRILAGSFNHMAQRIEDTVSMLRRFISDAAHEINTPITALHTNLELIDDQGEALDRARGQIRRLEGLAANLLQLSRLESGLYDPVEQDVDIKALVREAANIYISQADQKMIEMTFQEPDAPVVVRMSYEQLRSAVSNLLHNAIKFTPEKGEVRVSVMREDRKAVIRVEDTGIGIEVEDFPHLFERFYRGRSATRFAGSGLGLAIVQTIVQRANGTVTAENTGQGAQFTIMLPLSEQENGV